MRRVEAEDSYLPMTENHLKTEVLRVAYANGWKVRHETQARHLHRAGDDGFPDLILARQGQVLFMELKVEKAQLSLEQRMWFEELPAAHLIRPSDWYSGRVAELLA